MKEKVKAFGLSCFQVSLLLLLGIMMMMMMMIVMEEKLASTESIEMQPKRSNLTIRLTVRKLYSFNIAASHDSRTDGSGNA